MVKVISTANEKGGTGKSATAINIAYNLAEQGYKVLLVDNDKQGNTSTFYGYQNEQYGTHTLFTDENINIQDLVKPTDYENLDIVPTSLLMVLAINQVMFSKSKDDKKEVKRDKRKIYQNAFEQLSNEYDYIIVDNPSSFEINVFNSILASDEIIIPIKVDDHALQGLKSLMQQINNLCKQDEDLTTRTVSLLFTMARGSQLYERRVEEFKEEFLKGDYHFIRNIYDTKIRHREYVTTTTYNKKPLSVASKKNHATIDYQNLVEEILMKG